MRSLLSENPVEESAAALSDAIYFTISKSIHCDAVVAPDLAR